MDATTTHDATRRVLLRVSCRTSSRKPKPDGTFTEDTFFDRFSAELVDAGEIDTADRAHYSASVA